MNNPENYIELEFYTFSPCNKQDKRTKSPAGRIITNVISQSLIKAEVSWLLRSERIQNRLMKKCIFISKTKGSF